MPVPDDPASYFRQYQESPSGSLLDRLPTMPRPAFKAGLFDTSPAIGPGEVLAAVRTMDADQRRELAELLGVEAPHALLWTPGRSGEFLPPVSGSRPVSGSTG